ncbi:MAG: hypothetical protein WC812_03820 [Candidatus Pacearchaeota archaeon]|jgi:hypothetical protein
MVKPGEYKVETKFHPMGRLVYDLILKCPFDKFPLNYASEFPDLSGWICSSPNCRLSYGLTFDQNQINFEAKKYVEKWKQELLKNKQEKEKLLRNLEKAEQVGLIERNFCLKIRYSE